MINTNGLRDSCSTVCIDSYRKIAVTAVTAVTGRSTRAVG